MAVPVAVIVFVAVAVAVLMLLAVALLVLMMDLGDLLSVPIFGDYTPLGQTIQTFCARRFSVQKKVLTESKNTF